MLITGGDGDGEIEATAELFDPRTGLFSLTGNMSSQKDDHSAFLPPTGQVLVVGGPGAIGSYLPNTAVELYQP